MTRVQPCINRKGDVKNRKAIVLLSGGLDSATTLFYAKKKGFKCFCLIFDYAQRHKREIVSAKKITKAANCQYEILKINLPWKGSALLDNKIKLQTSCLAGRQANFKLQTLTIPLTYVPARNTIFLSFALSYAEAIGAEAIFIGANAVDFSGYPDCRPAYYKEFRKLTKLATKSGVEGKEIKIFTPLIKISKAEIIKLGVKLGVPYGLTWSCYKGAKFPCGVCDSCRFRAKGFKEAVINDPLLQTRIGQTRIGQTRIGIRGKGC